MGQCEIRCGWSANFAKSCPLNSLRTVFSSGQNANHTRIFGSTSFIYTAPNSRSGDTKTREKNQRRSKYLAYKSLPHSLAFRPTQRWQRNFGFLLHIYANSSNFKAQVGLWDADDCEWSVANRLVRFFEVWKMEKRLMESVRAHEIVRSIVFFFFVNHPFGWLLETVVHLTVETKRAQKVKKNEQKIYSFSRCYVNSKVACLHHLVARLNSFFAAATKQQPTTKSNHREIEKNTSDKKKTLIEYSLESTCKFIISCSKSRNVLSLVMSGANARTSDSKFN